MQKTKPVAPSAHALLSPAQAALAALYVAHRLSGADETHWQAHLDATPSLAGLTQTAALSALGLAEETANATDGVDALLDMLAAAVNAPQAETVYLICADYIALKGRVSPEEMRFIEKLGQALGLDRLSRAALDRAAQARAVNLATSEEDRAND